MPVSRLKSKNELTMSEPVKRVKGKVSSYEGREYSLSSPSSTSVARKKRECAAQNLLKLNLFNDAESYPSSSGLSSSASSASSPSSLNSSDFRLASRTQQTDEKISKVAGEIAPCPKPNLEAFDIMPEESSGFPAELDVGSLTPVKQRSGRTLPPPAPFSKNTKRSKTSCSPFVGKVRAALNNISSEFKSESGTQASFKLASKLRTTGQHSDVYRVRNGDPLFEGYENHQILFKCYKEELLDKYSIIDSFKENSIGQYQGLVNNHFPVAAILNVDTVENDGFFIVERIPYEFDPKNATDEQWEQVKQMFQFAYDECVELDLSPSNVRIDDEGNVRLIDFMERKEEHCQNPFALIAEKCLLSFSEGNRARYEYLMPQGFKKIR